MGTIEKKLTSGIAFAIGFVLMIVVLSIWQYRRIQDNGILLRHTNLVLFKTQEVLNAAVQYELNIKNFLLTGDSLFLRKADDSMASLRPQIAELKQLTSDNASQQPRLDSLLFYIDSNRQLLTRAMSESKVRDFGIPEWVWPHIAESWRRRDPHVYGRFDLRYDGSGPAKLLELVLSRSA